MHDSLSGAGGRCCLHRGGGVVGKGWLLLRLVILARLRNNLQGKHSTQAPVVMRATGQPQYMLDAKREHRHCQAAPWGWCVGLAEPH